MRKILILLLLASALSGQGWNTWNTWANWNSKWKSIIHNGDFETGSNDDNWVGKNVTPILDSVDPIAGIYSLKVSPSSAWFNIRVDDLLETDTWYFVSFKMRTQLDNYSGGYFYVYRGENTSVATDEVKHHLAMPTADREYEYSITFKTTSGESDKNDFIIEYNNTVTGNVWFDDFEIKKK